MSYERARDSRAHGEGLRSIAAAERRLAAFGEEFVRSGPISPDLFALLRDGFEDRAEGDYGLVEISSDQAEASIDGARRFVREIGRHREGTSGAGS